MENFKEKVKIEITVEPDALPERPTLMQVVSTRISTQDTILTALAARTREEQNLKEYLQQMLNSCKTSREV